MDIVEFAQNVYRQSEDLSLEHWGQQLQFEVARELVYVGQLLERHAGSLSPELKEEYGKVLRSVLVSLPPSVRIGVLPDLIASVKRLVPREVVSEVDRRLYSPPELEVEAPE